MALILISIEGKTPLLCNRFADAEQQQASNGTAAALVGDRGTPKEQAERKLYLDGKGNGGKPMIPQPNLLRCFIDAGKYFKCGKSKVTTQKSSMIPACVDLEGVAFQIKHKDPWTVDTRPVRIPSTGGRILRHRPCFNDWRLDVSVVLDTTMMATSLFRDIVDAAGNRIGLGDYRPDCKGPFGRFRVVNWKVESD